MRKFIKNLILILIIISAIGGQPVLAADYDLNTYVYNHLENWDAEFKIDYYKADVLDVVKDISKKDDYLSVSLDKLVYERVGSNAILKIVYKTTKEQEEYINAELTKIVKSITTATMSDVDKVEAINNYLINRYEYDDSLVSNNAYSALITGKTTCQGYALTAYKMLNFAGVNNKIVIGELDGVPHGWNLVKLNNEWYHLDVTNNDSIISDKYFLKSDEVLRNDGFTWNASDYPSCDKNYSKIVNDQSILSSDLEINNITENVSSSKEEYLNRYQSRIDGNWNFINNSWHFLKNTGSYAVGWNNIDNNWYYLGNDGAMRTEWIYSSGKWYYCYPGSGAMAVNVTINGYKIDSNGAWIP